MELEPKYKKKSYWWLYIVACLLTACITMCVVVAASGTTLAIDYDELTRQFSKLRAGLIWTMVVLVAGLIWYFRQTIVDWFSDMYTKLPRRPHRSSATVITVKDNWWWRKKAQLGKRYENAWNNHRGWLFSVPATAVILFLTLGMFHTQGAVIGPVALSVGKIIGGITWGIILLVLLVFTFRRFKSFTALVWAMIGGVTLVALAILATVIGYAKHASFYWWPLVALVILATIVGGVWWMKKSPSTLTPTPVPGTPQPNTPARSKRTGPPALIVVMTIAIDVYVIATWMLGLTPQWPFLHWPSTVNWWAISFVVLLTLLIFFADWGQPDRPNSARRSASNMVSAGFVICLVIAAVGVLTLMVSNIRW